MRTEWVWWMAGLIIPVGVSVALIMVTGVSLFSLNETSEELVRLPSYLSGQAAAGPQDRVSEGSVPDTGRTFRIITVLPQDAIPAILEPRFIPRAQGEEQLKSDELVLGLSINGDHRAYPIPLLSSHEIVNDVVGGVPVAVTW